MRAKNKMITIKKAKVTTLDTPQYTENKDATPGVGFISFSQ